MEQGAACLDLVTPTHFTDAVLEALGEERWPVPVVWNCGGYESVETLKRLEGRVQVYLPCLLYTSRCVIRDRSSTSALTCPFTFEK